MGALCGKSGKEQFPAAFIDPSSPRRLKILQNYEKNVSLGDPGESDQHSSSSKEQPKPQMGSKEPRKLRLGYHKYFDDKSPNKQIQIDNGTGLGGQSHQAQQTPKSQKPVLNNDENQGSQQNTVVNNVWDKQSSESWLFNNSKVLMDEQTSSLMQGSGDLQKLVGGNRILNDTNDSPSKKFYDDDYQSDIQILREMENFFDKPNSSLQAPLSSRNTTALEQRNSVSKYRYSTVSLTKTPSQLKHERSLIEIVKQKQFRTEVDFVNFLDEQIAPNVSFALTPQGFHVSRDLYESRLHKVTNSSAHQIERYCRLTNTSMLFYSDEFKAMSSQYRPVLTIPIINIKSIDRVLLKPKGNNQQLAYQTNSSSNKFFFKILLDAPLKERDGNQVVKKQAVTERIINETCEAFKDCELDEIKPRDNNTSDLCLTQILDNDEDKHSYLFQDEGSSCMQTSQSIREVMQQRDKGYNSVKSEYNEMFIMACGTELEAKKWVCLTKWLIRKHLIALT